MWIWSSSTVLSIYREDVEDVYLNIWTQTLQNGNQYDTKTQDLVFT